MSSVSVWIVIVSAAVGCYLLKLAGLAIPTRLLDRPLVSRIVDCIPAALLAALVAVNALTTDGAIVVDFRLAGLAAAALALALRAPFILVLVLAGAVGALGYGTAQ